MKVHCIGIGGAGLSGLARILRGTGHILSGEDAEDGPFIPVLRDAGIPVTVGAQASLPPDTDLVVRSAAVPADHPSVRQARDRKVPVRKYAEVLPLACEGARLVAVAGTHGKTTTSALISHILVKAGRDPSFLVGGHIPHLGGSARVGGGGIFVAEACEFDRSFLHLDPWAAVITNVEADHLDCYRDLDDIVETFGKFAAKVHPDGVLLIRDGDPGAERAATRARCRVERFRIGTGADWGAEEIQRGPGGTDLHLIHKGRDVGPLSIPLPGEHNVLNGLAAAAICSALGLSPEEVGEAARSFQTVDRRFQVIRSDDDLAVISDYAHHPTEIRTVIDACRQTYGDRRRVIVFQPHQRARTAAFLDRFAASLSDAGHCLIAPIYGAREAEDGQGVRAQTLVDRIRAMGGEAAVLPELPEIPSRVAREIRKGDVVLVVGAGDIFQVAGGIAEWRASAHPQVRSLPEERGQPGSGLGSAAGEGASGEAQCDLDGVAAARGATLMRDLTSFQLGGPAAEYRQPADLTELQRDLREAAGTGREVLYVGGGNNLLARDEGFHGVVIDLKKLCRITASRTRLVAQAGVSMPRLMRYAEELSLSGLECLAGIPGTVGGGVAMNAGGKFGAISDAVEGAVIVQPDGAVVFRRKEDLSFRYRGCDTGGGVIFEVVFSLSYGRRQEIRRRSAEIMKGKRQVQPYGVPSAGCIFKNPQGDSAGRLIDAAGLKGERIGGAMVSMLHANFIVNDGEATSSDVLRLIGRVQETVKERFGVDLQLEVKVV